MKAYAALKNKDISKLIGYADRVCGTTSGQGKDNYLYGGAAMITNNPMQFGSAHQKAGGRKEYIRRSVPMVSQKKIVDVPMLHTVPAHIKFII